MSKKMNLTAKERELIRGLLDAYAGSLTRAAGAKIRRISRKV